jgi:hypothetical protein
VSKRNGHQNLPTSRKLLLCRYNKEIEHCTFFNLYQEKEEGIFEVQTQINAMKHYFLGKLKGRNVSNTNPTTHAPFY